MKYRQRLGPPPATMNRLLAEPAGGPWVNCAGVEVLRGRFVGGRIIKVPKKVGMVREDHIKRMEAGSGNIFYVCRSCLMRDSTIHRFISNFKFSSRKFSRKEWPVSRICQCCQILAWLSGYFCKTKNSANWLTLWQKNGPKFVIRRPYLVVKVLANLFNRPKSCHDPCHSGLHGRSLGLTFSYTIEY
jgi:hypothetical protein